MRVAITAVSCQLALGLHRQPLANWPQWLEQERIGEAGLLLRRIVAGCGHADEGAAAAAAHPGLDVGRVQHTAHALAEIQGIKPAGDGARERAAGAADQARGGDDQVLADGYIERRDVEKIRIRPGPGRRVKVAVGETAPDQVQGKPRHDHAARIDHGRAAQAGHGIGDGAQVALDHDLVRVAEMVGVVAHHARGANGAENYS